jgi:hypothetical protein
METSTELIAQIKTMIESECKLFLLLIKNKQQLALLEREAEWFSTHHSISDTINHSVCSKCYSGDTDFEFKCNLIDLVLSLFNKTQGEL